MAEDRSEAFTSMEPQLISHETRQQQKLADLALELTDIEPASTVLRTPARSYCAPSVAWVSSKLGIALDAATAGANKAHDKRALRLWRNEKTGLMNLAIELTFEEGALFEQAVEKAAVQLSGDTANTPSGLQGKDVSWHALQADAAMLIIREYLNGGSSASANDESARGSAADLYQVVVHVDEKALVAGSSSDSSSSA